MAFPADNNRKPDPPEPQKLKVFISYSRDDMAFADELGAGLEYEGGFEVSIDRTFYDSARKVQRHESL